MINKLPPNNERSVYLIGRWEQATSEKSGAYMRRFESFLQSQSRYI
ncbi:hypothetical protein [Salmonella phage AR2819]|nr:hypothetical protein [Salmonella phage AR2819]